MANYTIRHSEAAASTDQTWQDAGVAIMFKESEKRVPAQCTLGLDFGTAFTKACVQIRNQTFVIQWNTAVPSCSPGLLPGVFTERPDGSCVLGTARDGKLHSNLKMGLLSGASRVSQAEATVFLGLVTRYIRSWLFGHPQYSSVFRSFRLDWSVNVGLPAVPWDNLELRELYRNITVAGWNLGSTKGRITLQGAEAALARVHSGVSGASGEIARGKVEAFPEFVAQINSYRKSPQGRRDLHLLVDVGAGTVDIVTFHVWEPNEEDCYSILTASVEAHGTHVLLGYRADAGKIALREWEDSSARLSQRQFESTFKLGPGKISPVQDYFVEKVHFAMERVLRLTKTTRYETSPAWRDGLPVFFCGGGREVDAYRDAIKMAARNRRLVEFQLPWPDGLIHGQVQRKDFHRVSVAHGLSYSADNIGRIERKSEVPDLRRPQTSPRDISERYTSKSDC